MRVVSALIHQRRDQDPVLKLESEFLVKSGHKFPSSPGCSSFPTELKDQGGNTSYKTTLITWTTNSVLTAIQWLHLLMQRELLSHPCTSKHRGKPLYDYLSHNFRLYFWIHHFFLFPANQHPIISTFPTICTLFRNVWKTSPSSAVGRWGAQGFLCKVPSLTPLGTMFLLHNYVVRDSSRTVFINLVPWISFRASLCFLTLYRLFCISIILDGVLIVVVKL